MSENNLMFWLRAGFKKEDLPLTCEKNCSVNLLSGCFLNKKNNCEPVGFIKAEASPEADSRANPSLKLSGSLKPQIKKKL